MSNEYGAVSGMVTEVAERMEPFTEFHAVQVLLIITNFYCLFPDGLRSLLAEPGHSFIGLIRPECLGGAVAEVLMDEHCGNIKFKRLALPDVNVSKIGSQDWLREQYGLGVKHIINTVKELVK